MNIKTLAKPMTTATALAGALLLATSAQAGPGKRNVNYDYAKVVGVDPITETVRVSTPRRECWTEKVEHYKERKGYKSATPVILGSIIGGAIGNELGHHKDAKRGGLLVGAILGGSIGRDIQRSYGRNHSRNHGGTYYTNEEVCKTYNDYHDEERVVGYNVAYKYRGHVYHTETPQHPGKRIKVKVKVIPVHEY